MTTTSCRVDSTICLCTTPGYGRSALRADLPLSPASLRPPHFTPQSPVSSVFPISCPPPVRSPPRPLCRRPLRRRRHQVPLFPRFLPQPRRPVQALPRPCVLPPQPARRLPRGAGLRRRLHQAGRAGANRRPRHQLPDLAAPHQAAAAHVARATDGAVAHRPVAQHRPPVPHAARARRARACDGTRRRSGASR